MDVMGVKQSDMEIAAFSSKVKALRHMDHETWRREGRSLVKWMNAEAEDMARAEKDSAVAKVTGGSAAIAGGLLTGVGVVASFLTFGLAAPLAIAGVAIGSAGGLTAAGSDVAKRSIMQHKTCQIKEKCEAFARRSQGLLGALMETGKFMGEMQAQQVTVGSSSCSVQDTLETIFGRPVRSVGSILAMVSELEKICVAGGRNLVQVGAAAKVGGTARISSCNRAAFLEAGVGAAAASIAFGIWDVVEAAGTLQNGGSHACLIRDNASQVENTIAATEKLLQLLLP